MNITFKMKGAESFMYRSRGFVLVGVQEYAREQKRKNEIRENFYKKYRFTIKISDNKATFFNYLFRVILVCA